MQSEICLIPPHDLGIFLFFYSLSDLKYTKSKQNTKISRSMSILNNFGNVQ